MKTIPKALAGTIAAGAMAMTSAAPAFARDRNDDGISTGEIIAGAVILGGIAAVLSSGNRDRDRYSYRDRDNRQNYNRRGNGRRAVQQCVAAAERDAHRAGYRFADVTQIRDVDKRRGGWSVKGRIVVDGSRGYSNRGYNRDYNRDYNRGDRYDRQDRRGYNQHRRGYRNDAGTFRCDFSRGRVVGLSYNGIRGLR
ncbi:hypothetical protein [Pontixanthobacter gangjinensis]|uniref:Uncharacterized protein n=1 Tax=Pontixanthobacter gangjinensis TaxID=1028742 RepID=A0A6I4SND4_9SPHN|nr:hypothetical protein [Pontixanthobacter gangjinensis]MXO56666.1 hypothetical protein [Pontixanthobacter gangjinensis]